MNVIFNKDFFSKNKIFFISFFLLLVINLLWLWVYFPGILSHDSLYHWQQSISQKYDGITPYFYTLIILFSRKIVDTPAIIALIQVLTSALIISYFLNYFYRKGTNNRLVYLAIFLYIFIPAFSVFNITLWKDAFFAQGILLIGLLWLTEFIEDRPILREPLGTFFLASVVMFVSLIRLNGLIYIIITPLIYYIIGKRKKALYLLLMLLIFYAIFHIFTPRLLGVDNKRMGYFKEVSKIQMMASAIKHGRNVSPVSVSLYSEIIPIDQLKNKYHCSAIDYLYIGESSFNEKVFYDKDFVKKFNLSFYRTLINNPIATIRDRGCLASYLLGFGDSNRQYYYQLVTPDNNFGIMNSKNKLKRYFDGYLFWTTRFPQVHVFWFNFAYLLVFLYYLVVSVLKKNYTMIIFEGIILVNVVALTVVGVARDFRYLFMVLFSLPFLPMIYYVTKNKKKINCFKNNCDKG